MPTEVNAKENRFALTRAASVNWRRGKKQIPITFWILSSALFLAGCETTYHGPPPENIVTTDEEDVAVYNMCQLGTKDNVLKTFGPPTWVAEGWLGPRWHYETPLDYPFAPTHSTGGFTRKAHFDFYFDEAGNIVNWSWGWHTPVNLAYTPEEDRAMGNMIQQLKTRDRLLSQWGSPDRKEQDIAFQHWVYRKALPYPLNTGAQGTREAEIHIGVMDESGDISSWSWRWITPLEAMPKPRP
jgi:hypothetical protein